MEQIIVKQGEHLTRSYIGQARNLTIEIKDGSSIDLLLLTENESGEQQLDVTAGRDCRIRIITLDLGGVGFTRRMIIDLRGEGTQCELSGVFATSGEEECTNRIRLNHRVGNCHSEQTFRGVASGMSRAAFGGHIYVARDAQQTVALQENHNILLSDGARIETRPELEIYADNVKCNHGATVGREDAQAMFYLRQRGIEPQAARALLTEGFCRAALRMDAFDKDVQQIVAEKLGAKLLQL